MACVLPAYPTDVTVNNPLGVVYVCGNETTDGSYRFVCDESRMVIRAEKRVAGVWVIADMEHQISTWVIDDILGEIVLDENGLLVLQGE